MGKIKLCVTVLTAAVVINFLRDGRTFHIAKVLPFSNGPEKVGLYDWASVIVLFIIVWGIYRLKNRKE